MSQTETVSKTRRPSYSCQHCQTSFRKLKTLQLHIREDHQEKTDEEQTDNEKVQLDSEDVHYETENPEGETSLDGENESENTPELGFESAEAEDITSVEITPLSSYEQTEELQGDSRLLEENEPAEDFDTVVIEDNSEDESDVKQTRDQDIPILPKQTILKLIESSGYFQKKPTIIKAYEPSFKNFDIIDPSLPRGFLVREQVRSSSPRHVDKEFLSPDGQFVLRSRVAVTEYTKMILGHHQAGGGIERSGRREKRRATPVKRRSSRLSRAQSVVSVSPQPKKVRLSEGAGQAGGGKFREKLRSRLSSSRPGEDEDLVVLSSSLPASTRIKLNPGPSTSSTPFFSSITRRGLTITPVLPSNSRRERKKIKCCDTVFLTMAGFESHRVKKHSSIVRDSTARRPKSRLGETLKRKELPSSDKQVDHGCEYCEEKFSSMAELRNHDKTNHKFKCTICKEAFVNKLTFLEHTKANHIVPCQYCKQVFSSQDTLNFHLEKHHSFQCKDCQETFRLSSSLSKHVSEKHNFPCAFCTRIIDSAEARETHIETEHRHCQTCEDDFFWPDWEHGCYYTKTGTRPATDRVIEQRLYRGYFFFSADEESLPLPG